MAITRISLEHFKRFGGRADVDLAPITVLMGVNSSGKSSIVHSLAALKQTAVRKTAGRSLILDGTDVLVSLGRFVDAVHGQNYKKKIGLGLRFTARVPRFSMDGTRVRVVQGEMEYYWRFAGTMKTQRIRLDSRTARIDGDEYLVRSTAKGGAYEVALNGAVVEALVSEVQNLGFRIRPMMPSLSGEMNDLLRWETMNAADDAMLRELEKVRYLGPFREPPRRLYPYHGPVQEVGRTGNQAIPMLVSELTASSRSRPGIERVELWLDRLGLAKKMELKRQGASDSFRVGLRAVASNVDSTPADVGYGVSQVLPVLVQGSFAQEGDTLLFEQPELHLHPRAQRSLGDFFVDTAKRTGSRMLIETHSHELVGSFQQAIRAGELDPSWLKVILVCPGQDIPDLRVFKGDEGGDLWDTWDTPLPRPFDG